MALDTTKFEKALTDLETASQDFRVKVPETIDAGVLSDGVSISDVYKKRDQLESASKNTLDNFDQTVAKVTPFSDPERYIMSALYGDAQPTDTEKKVDSLNKKIVNTAEGIGSSLEDARASAEQRVGYTETNSELAKTNEKIAQRQTQFRREIRAFDEDARNRSINRAFFDNQKTKIEADATAELADLYIIQNAQQGNLDSARSYIDVAVDNRYKSIQLDIQAKQAELATLIPKLEKEEKNKALKLQFALGERERNLATEKEDAKTMRELALTAASNGATSDVVTAITNSKSVNDAISKASPYVGLLERQAASRAAYSASLSNRKALIDLALSGDKDAMAKLGSLGESIQAQLDAAKTTAEREQRQKTINTSYEIAEKLNIAERIATSPAFGAATGVLQNNPFLRIGGGAAAGAGTGFVGGSAIPGIGNVVGTVIGGVAGAGVATKNYLQTEKARETLFDDIESLTSRETLQTLIDAKAEGATFGALSDAELNLLIQATNALSSKIETDGSGRIIGLSGTPESIQRSMNEVVRYYQKAADSNFRNALDDEDKNTIYNLPD